ncbi:cysteine proteinase [Linderina pennispora]|uniref:Cysteine proteinase n=1 Tax=Linderina pennispora TaxID=61395 RepID=A0A1Y1W0U2_9FUNG|nr:cysteine proteinase [Linderina pennispora]ORX66925.1 cysteine proteinase [Linderina pennispora]
MPSSSKEPSAEPSLMPREPASRESGRKKRRILVRPNRSMPKQSAFQRITAAEDLGCLEKYVPLYNNYHDVGSAVYHWEIDSWSELVQGSLSPKFSVAGSTFQILAYPSGTTLPRHVALYIQYSQTDTAPHDGYACAYFALLISNPADPTVGIKSAFQHRFSTHHEAFGADDFGRTSKMTVIQPGFHREVVLENCVRISAYIRVINDETGTLWDPQFPAALGLSRLLLFPYLNGLLQMFYHLRVLRQAILQVPISGECYRPVLDSIHCLFSTFDEQEAAANPMDVVDALTRRSITSLPATEIQEFCTLLRNELIRSLRNTFSAGAIATLFQGRIRTTITNTMKHASRSHSEDIHDLMLDIRNHSCLHDSLAAFCHPAPLSFQKRSDNQDVQQPAGMQRTCFERLPLVLHLHLNRFERERDDGCVVVQPDPFEFPLSIDMNPFICEPKQPVVPSVYVLTGVHFCHQNTDGELTYSCFLYRGNNCGWVQCIDGVVSPVNGCEVLDLGTRVGPITILRNRVKRITNPAEQVYMLVYIRKDVREHIVAGDDFMDLSPDD